MHKIEQMKLPKIYSLTEAEINAILKEKYGFSEEDLACMCVEEKRTCLIELKSIA